MLFNSLQFLIFFPAVCVLYYVLPYKYRWVMLLAASYYFYMVWNPAYIVIILISTATDYYIAARIESEQEQRIRKLLLAVSMICNFGILFVFKYYNFFTELLASGFNAVGIDAKMPSFTLLLPVGISFYTFQTVSYTIDVYMRKRPAERHFGMFALYVSFFPQLVAGPIERSEVILPQLYDKHDFDYDRVTHGLKRMAWGYFEKMVVADNISGLVNNVYGNPTMYSGFPLFIATVLFAFQILCDFAGYTDIAIGAAEVMGIRLTENFRHPYFAASIRDFWSRWHITLSTWFRDYVYIPLGGNRVSPMRKRLNLLITFTVSGLWHGANLTFIAWGFLHGLYQIIEDLLNPVIKCIGGGKRFALGRRIMKGIIVFCAVDFAWIFFRAENVHDAIYIATHLFADIKMWVNPQHIWNEISGLHPEGGWSLIVTAASVSILVIVQLYMEAGRSISKRVKSFPASVRLAGYIGFLLFILVCAYVGTSEFIYFQF